MKQRNAVGVAKTAALLTALLALSGCAGIATEDYVGGDITPAPNHPPQATDDAGVTNVATAVTINIITNDTDVDGAIDPTSIVLATPPVNGSATVNDNGTVQYRPFKSFRGPHDSFTYSVADDEGDVSDIATVTITVNQLPIALEGCSSTRQEVMMHTGMLRGTDPEDGPNSLTFNLVSGPAPDLGQLTVNSDGSFVFDPYDTGPGGKFSFTWSLEDSAGGLVTATDTIVVAQKIMPLGDSTTFGTLNSPHPEVDKRVGYRRKLYNQLVAAGYTIDFVGGRSHGSSATPPISDSDHEGHGGARVLDMVTGRARTNFPGLFQALDDNPADIILLHIGTNDGPKQATADDIDIVFNEIDRWEDANHPVTVVVARIIDQNPQDPVVEHFNTALEEKVNARVANRNDLLLLADLHGALNYPDDLADTRHPTQAGYDKMSRAWFDVVVPLLEKCP